MSDIIISEEQLLSIQGKILEENKIQLNESEWYNTVGDVLGLIDPTPTIDFINGLSYISQGDYLFGLLSLISAVPYLGDAVAKPVTGALKIGGTATKEIELALKASKAGNFVKAEQILTKLAGEPGVVGNFVRTGDSWVPKVKNVIERVPFGPFKGLRNTVNGWFDLFASASKNSKGLATSAGGLATKMASTISKEEKVALLTSFLKDAKSTNFFNKANFTKSPKSFMNMWGGMPRLFGNREARALVRKTKFWLGFLDYIGLGNFVGPDEVANALGGEDAMKKKFDEYLNTPEAANHFRDDFQGVNSQIPAAPQQQTTPAPSDTTRTGAQSMFKSVFGGLMRDALFAL
jgi:hypothetical protein